MIAISRLWPSSPVTTHVEPIEPPPLAITTDAEALPEPAITHPQALEATSVEEPAVETPAEAPVAEAVLPEGVMPYTRTIAWPSLIAHDAGDLTVDERMALIEGLALVDGTWVTEILAQAFDEESDDLRVAVVEALAHSSDPIVTAMLKRAYTSHIVAERYAAIEGASRRGEIALLQRGIRDTDSAVALAAAYGLHVAHRDDLVEEALTDRDDVRANEIRRLLPLLSW